MNILSAYSPHVDSRPDTERAHSARTDVRNDVRRPDVAGTRRVTRDTRTNDVTSRDDAKVDRKTSRADFAALLALLADAGPKVRAELLAQVPAEGVSLIDQLLQGTMESLGSEAVPAAPVGESTDAADALRYGILNDQRASHTSDNALNSLLTTANDQALTAALTKGTGARESQQHARDILSRIAASRGSSVDQLKALGDEEAADVRLALDALLARAGTPAGMAIADNTDWAAINAAALAAANARSAADVSKPVADTDALSPELQQKLGRVIERMRNEYGHDVRVVETVRSQERQDYLFEQGRSRPGNIVTWTRDSAHTHGDAVDVNIDGSWSNAEGFARLQRIAREEGLRTLGVRDPGHLELADTNRPQNTLGARFNETTAQAKNAAPMVASPAVQSGIAQVAQVAGAAGIARVAEPGVGRGSYSHRESSATRAVTDGALGESISIASAASAGNKGNSTTGRGLGDDASRSSHQERSTSTRNTTQAPAADGTLVGAPTVVIPATGSSATTQATNASASAGVNAAERVADLQDKRDSAPAGELSRMTLNVDTPEGGRDRITVDVRGTSVGTRIDTDAASADRLRLQTADLQDALGRHGLESESVRIGSNARSETADARLLHSERDAAKIAGAQQSAGNEGAMNHGQRERAAFAREWERHDTARDARDEQQRDAEQREAAKRNAREEAHDGQRGRRETFNWSNS